MESCASLSTARAQSLIPFSPLTTRSPLTISPSVMALFTASLLKTPMLVSDPMLAPELRASISKCCIRLDVSLASQTKQAPN